jgi:hypothetical protein
VTLWNPATQTLRLNCVGRREQQTTFDGTSKRRKAIVGTVEAFPTEASALKAAKALRIDANQQTPHFGGGPGTIAELVAHYRLKELVGENQGRKSFSTRAG